MVVSGPLFAKSKVVSNQDVLGPKAMNQYILDKGLRRLIGQLMIKTKDHALIYTTTIELIEFVPQVGNPWRGKRGVLLKLGKELSGVGLEGHHAAGHASVPCL
jgi:hypothetical protein